MILRLCFKMNAAHDILFMFQIVVIHAFRGKLVNDTEGRQGCLFCKIDVCLIMQLCLDRIHIVEIMHAVVALIVNDQ